MARAKISDVAKQAGLSISTVNRVLNEPEKVREETIKAVLQAAEAVGFYGLGTIKSQINTWRPKLRFGFLLLQPTRTFYKMLGAALQAAAEKVEGQRIEVSIIYAEDLSPESLANHLITLGENCDAIGVVAPVHPLITQAVEALAQRNIPVFALITQLSATGSVNYVGFDNWKVGRTAAWVFHKFTKGVGKIGILVGNHRFRCQEMNEAGFRSYFREYAPDTQVLEAISTFETASVAEEMTEKLIHQHSDLSALYVAGGGISGALRALRSTGKAGHVHCIGYQMMESTRQGLLDGSLTLAISYQLEAFAEVTITGMINAQKAGKDATPQTHILPFEIYSRENI
ncbi:MAG: LacI family DNA-binding transcriptional regulator [Alphaproteobacteria bacterium]|nr:LacI family DNA-binding transcriptional regulator [Alphaproteobacteria bacterium]